MITDHDFPLVEADALKAQLLAHAGHLAEIADEAERLVTIADVIRDYDEARDPLDIDALRLSSDRMLVLAVDCADRCLKAPDLAEDHAALRQVIEAFEAARGPD